MKHRSPLLDDPVRAARVWARYRRTMAWLMLLTVLLVLGTAFRMWRGNGLVSVDFLVIAALVTGFAMLVASAVMGFAFLGAPGCRAPVSRRSREKDLQKP